MGIVIMIAFGIIGVLFLLSALLAGTDNIGPAEKGSALLLSAIAVCCFCIAYLGYFREVQEPTDKVSSAVEDAGCTIVDTLETDKISDGVYARLNLMNQDGEQAVMQVIINSSNDTSVVASPEVLQFCSTQNP